MEKGERERMVFVCVYIDNDTDSRTRPKLIWKINFNDYSINTFAFEQNATNHLVIFFNKSTKWEIGNLGNYPPQFNQRQY